MTYSPRNSMSVSKNTIHVLQVLANYQRKDCDEKDLNVFIPNHLIAQ